LTLLARLRNGTGQTAYSASLLLMVSALLSGVLGLVRNTLIASLFGDSPQMDAYTGAFQLPDTVSYLLIGGVAATTFVKMLTQFQAEGREAEGDRALANILNVMLVILAAAMLLAAAFAPLYVRYAFKNFDSPATAHMCVQLTRMLLVNQLFLFAGGVFGSRLLVRKIFLYQAMQPILYNGGIIVGAVLLHRSLGVYSLAIGAVLGAFFGFFLINFIGSRSIGMQWSPRFDLRDPALHQWVRLSLPLMLGQSLVTLDPWIRNHFAGPVPGAIALMNYGRTAFNAPMQMIGPAAGAASLPFFASLWVTRDIDRFSDAVNRSVSRLMGVSLLLTGWMVAVASPLIDLMLRHGRLTRANAEAAAELFLLFALSLVFWTSQNLYARAFYAAGNTLTPMISGTVITVLSLPVYALLFRTNGIAGLVIASDLGIGAHMVALAMLLHRRRMVSLLGLEWAELGKALLAALCSGIGALLVLRVMPLGSSHTASFVRLLVGSVMWLAIAAAVLLVTRSALPNAILRRRRSAA
jgi:putative peptidoglycan lipid II flippase